MPTNNIPNIYTINGGLQYIPPLNIRDVSVVTVNRPWILLPYSWSPPVTVNIGVPIVQMPGCVKTHKENASNPSNKSSSLVNDDPDQNVVLCDGGMPYYEPPDYRCHTWQTVYGNQRNKLVV